MEIYECICNVVNNIYLMRSVSDPFLRFLKNVTSSLLQLGVAYCSLLQLAAA